MTPPDKPSEHHEEDHHRDGRQHEHHHHEHHPKRLRLRVYQLLSADRHDPWSRFIEHVLVAFILLNAASIVLESVPSVSARYGQYFDLFDLFSVGVFTIEYALRLWSAPEQPAFLFHKTVVDLLAIVPFYLGLLVGLDGSEVRIIRILRLLKLARYSGAMVMIENVLVRERQVISATLAVMAVSVVVLSVAMYTFEHDAQPNVFRDIPTTFWWAIVTLTTIGYGDMVPVTLAGRILGGLTAVIGVGVIALPAGVLASGFLSEIHRRREAYARKIEKALSDGALTHAERRMLARLRGELRIDPEEAEWLIERAQAAHDLTCPHCGERVFERPQSQPPEGEHSAPTSR